MTSLAMRPTPARTVSGTSPEAAETAETARLFEEHSERILAYCLRRLGSRSEAEDAVQMTFLYALRALRRGVVPESETAWLYAIAKNVCRWQRRTQSRRGPLADHQDVDELAGPDRDHAEDDELGRDLKEALVALPANQRRALVLREWHGLSSSEVAERMGMSAPATYALLTRARGSFVQAFTALRHPAYGLGWLLFELRSHVKALLGGASAKAAVATVAVVGVGVGGVVADKGLGRAPAAPQAPAPAQADGQRVADTDAARTGPSLVPRPKAADPAQTRTSLPTRPAAGVLPSTGPVEVLVPRSRPRSSDPASDPSGDQDTVPVGTPKEEPTGVVPLDPLQLPKVELPTDLLPPVELPPLPPVQVPDLPPVELPPVDMPPAPPLPLP